MLKRTLVKEIFDIYYPEITVEAKDKDDQGAAEWSTLISKRNREDFIKTVQQAVEVAYAKGGIDEVSSLHRSIDNWFDLIKKIQIGYKGSTTIEAVALQNLICSFENDLEKELKKVEHVPSLDETLEQMGFGSKE